MHAREKQKVHVLYYVPQVPQGYIKYVKVPRAPPGTQLKRSTENSIFLDSDIPPGLPEK